MRSAILSAWLRTKLAMRKDPAALAHMRDRLTRRLRPALRRTPGLASWAEHTIADIPVSDPQQMRDDVGRWNSLGITQEEAHAAATDAEGGGTGEVRPGIVAGFSTGTSGTNGLFLASASERADYVGQSLARLLPASALLSGARIALVLRADSSLYRDVGKAGAFRFLFLPLTMARQERAAALRSFAPDTLIAPAHILADLARSETPLPGLKRLFWGAEPMGAAERNWIGSVLGVRPDPIWQATEGFLGAACRHGALHLNEASIRFDFEPIPGTTAFLPIISDLRRFSQSIIRCRIDDVVEPIDTPCPCGFGARTIRPIAGRAGDIWRLPQRSILPREVTERFEAQLGPSAQWVALASAQETRAWVNDPAHIDAARAALHALAPELPAHVEIRETLQDGPKRRRVRWQAA